MQRLRRMKRVRQGGLFDMPEHLEHFAIKWKPVNRNKMRQNKEIEHGFDSIKTKTCSKADIEERRSVGDAGCGGGF